MLKTRSHYAQNAPLPPRASLLRRRRRGGPINEGRGRKQKRRASAFPPTRVRVRNLEENQWMKMIEKSSRFKKAQKGVKDEFFFFFLERSFLRVSLDRVVFYSFDFFFGFFVELWMLITCLLLRLKFPWNLWCFFLSFLLFESLACSSSSKMQILPNVDEGKLILIFICEYSSIRFIGLHFHFRPFLLSLFLSFSVC